MRIELKYFTGTGNSLKILDTCRKTFVQAGYSAEISEINLNSLIIPESDILGFCFPVYAFGIPRICKKYLKAINRFSEKKKVFVLVTAGDSDEAGYSIKECGRFLRKKNCDIIYSGVIQMPVNWTTSPKPPFPPSKEEAVEIIKNGVTLAEKIAHDIINGLTRQHVFNIPKRYTRFGFYWDYWLFKYMGIQHMWRTFKVYDSCKGCQTCSRICPTRSIKIIDKKPVWASTCEQCMRCVNFCPNESIYQSMGGETKGKNKYYEPGFNPRTT
jgi:Pyruvate/2-oxoacid:ferredoxin oxidoreductase delta subunit